MENYLFGSFLSNSTFGYSLCRIIVNDNGDPVNYTFLDTNPVFDAMHSYETGYLKDLRVTEAKPLITNDKFDWLSCFVTVAITGRSVEVEAFSEARNCWYKLSISSPEKGYFVVLSIDITEKKNIEHKLLKSEEANRLYIESAPDGIFIVDVGLHYIDVNIAACKMVGYTKAELLNKSVYDLIPFEDNDKHRNIISNLMETGKARGNVHLLSKIGTRISVCLDAVRMQTGQYLAFCKDIGEQEKIETEKNQYYFAFQSTSQPILITDANGKITAINSAFVNMYGYGKEELIGEQPHILNPGRAVYENLGISIFEYDSMFRDLWQSVQNPAVRTWKGELINRRKNNSLVWVSLLVNAIYDEGNNLKAMVGMPIDMTLSHELIVNNRVQLYQTIADLAELRDDETGNHMKRVGLFSKLIARELGMNEKYCNDIEIFAPMHDIGKVGILDSILLAPRKLTVEEFEIMKSHTVLGHNIVKGKQDFEMAAAITLCHHERFDGSGYPNGIGGKHIPLSAHITSLCDVYDALRSKRPYKEPWTHADTLKYIYNSSGTHFDPDIIQIFLKLEDRFDMIFQELVD